MLIRRFQPSDPSALWQVFFSAIHQTAAADYTPEQLDAWAPPQPDLAQWAIRLQKIRPFVAEMEGQIVGYADLQEDGYIDHFFVSGSMARRGVGSALMRRILDEASIRRIGRIYSQVSITARPFFERFGFEVEVSQQVCWRGVIFDNFRMQKSLPIAQRQEG